MIKNITLTINGRTFGDRLSTYTVRDEVTYQKVTTTIAGKEIVTRKRVRPIVEFSMLPYAGDVANADYNVLKAASLSVTYTDPDSNQNVTRNMRLDSGIGHLFMLNSVNGKIYYHGEPIILRSIEIK